jgi:hypothetical protein
LIRKFWRGLHDNELFVGNLGEGRLIEAQVRLDHLRRQAPEPLVKRDVLENVGGEHLQEYRIGLPRVLDIMTGVGGYIADGGGMFELGFSSKSGLFS